MHKIWKYFVPFDKSTYMNITFFTPSFNFLHVFALDFRLPLPFLGAFGAALMLMYQVRHNYNVPGRDHHYYCMYILHLYHYSGCFYLQLWASSL